MKVVAKLRQRGEKDQPPKLLCYIKWLKNVVSFFFCFVLFCFENAKNLGRSNDAKRRKKWGWPKPGFKRGISHVPNLMQMRKIYCFRLFSLDSAHVICGIKTGLKL